jgi:phage tail tape-measure protein
VGKTPNGMPAGTPLANGTPLNNAFKNIGGAKGAMKIGGLAAVSAAFVAIPKMNEELEAIKQNEELTNKERGRAKGGAVGEAVGSIGGAAAGAIAGAAIGSVVPVVGTALGALAGGLIGYFGGKAGRKIGEGIGEGLAKDEPLVKEQQTVAADDFASYNPQLQEAYFREMQSMPRIADTARPVIVDGEIRLQSQLIIDDSGYRLSQAVVQNTTPYKFATGNAFDARLTP